MNFRCIAIFVVLPQAMAANCKSNDFGGLQEMVLLICAFTVGWHLIGPFLGLLLRRKAGCIVDACEDEEEGLGDASVKMRGLRGDSERASDLVEAWLSEADEANYDCFVEESDDLPKPKQYSEALEACVLSEDLDSACRLLQRTSWQVPGPKGARQLLILARRLLKRRDIASAEKCIERAGEVNVDARTRKLLIVACTQSGDMEKGRKYFQQLKAHGKADSAIYSTMMRSSCNAGKVDEALEFLEMMLQDQLPDVPDAMLLDALLESSVSRNLFHGAERILRLMKDLGIPPSNTTLAACIKLYACRGGFEKAHAVFEDMVQTHQLQPNSYVYGALIAAAYRHGKPEIALASFDASGCPPSARTYEHLVQCCLQLGLLDRAVDFVDEALGLNESPRRVFMDPKVVEELLVLITRRKESERLGLPLLKRLEAADELPDTFQRFAHSTGFSSHARSKRKEDFDRWRTFSR